jgi:hypothetical protein
MTSPSEKPVNGVSAAASEGKLSLVNGTKKAGGEAVHGQTNGNGVTADTAVSSTESTLSVSPVQTPSVSQEDILEQIPSVSEEHLGAHNDDPSATQKRDLYVGNL